MPPDETKANVLLVDDQPENLLVLEAVLERLGQNLVKANSGSEALRCLLNQDFAVILLDVQMPEINGFETATLIRQRTRSRNTPIIFITAFSSSDSLVFKGYSLGAVDYLMKPIDPAILTSKVSVFVELFKKNLEVERQAAQLKAINTELQRSEERFRSLSACSPVGIFLTDTHGQCTYTNPRFEAICGCSLGADWVSDWNRLLHPSDRDLVFTSWASTIQKNESYSGEFRICPGIEEERWVQVRMAPMRSDLDDLLGYVGTIEDITERKQAETMREQMIRAQAARQQAETANRMKDEFLAIVSHELRTPLNAILGWSKLLLTKTLEDATKQHALEIIERNARSQAQLIEDILDISQIIRGKLRLALQPVNLMGLIQAVSETMQPMLAAKAIHLETCLNSQAAMVTGDPERLRQIIWNLLSNAIKFTPEGGRVGVELSVVGSQVLPAISGLSIDGHGPSSGGHLENQAPGAHHPEPGMIYAQITITDTGIGIDPEFLPHVFDRFRQADSTITRSYGGLGLGLAIVRHLVEQHHGSIWADSEGVGKGATFTVCLPLVEASVNPSALMAGPQAEDTLPTLEQLTVLVVEDHEDARNYIVMVLEQAGATVLAAASVQEAMAALTQASIDVLVSDISMPEADGYQLIRAVRALEESQGQRLPAIALTAYARAEDRALAIENGFQLHLAKPIEPAELLAAVAQLHQESVRSHSAIHL